MVQPAGVAATEVYAGAPHAEPSYATVDDAAAPTYETTHALGTTAGVYYGGQGQGATAGVRALATLALARPCGKKALCIPLGLSSAKRENVLYTAPQAGSACPLLSSRLD